MGENHCEGGDSSYDILFMTFHDGQNGGKDKKYHRNRIQCVIDTLLFLNKELLLFMNFYLILMHLLQEETKTKPS